MTQIKFMHIDIETYCNTDLEKSGLYKYAESKNFEILTFAEKKDLIKYFRKLCKQT